MKGGQESKRRSRERGAIYIEVLMALLPVLLTFFGVVQLALFKIGALVVQHAATRAVRAAVVMLHDEPKYYAGAARGDLTGGSSVDSGGLTGFMGKFNQAYTKIQGKEEPNGGARLNRIRAAAYHPLAVLAPPLTFERTLQQELGGSPWTRIAFGAEVFGLGAAAVTLRSSSGEVQTEFGVSDAVTVRVAFLMPCGVPLVSSLMCSRALDLGRASLGFQSSERASNIMGEMEHVASPVQRDGMLALGGRFILLTAEATLPNQGASYHQDKEK